MNQTALAQAAGIGQSAISLAETGGVFRQHTLHPLYGGENAFLLSEYCAALHDAGFRKIGTRRSYDSVINYAPHDRASLRAKFHEKLEIAPLGNPIARLLQSGRALSLADRRPGLPVSFVAEK